MSLASVPVGAFDDASLEVREVAVEHIGFAFEQFDNGFGVSYRYRVTDYQYLRQAALGCNCKSAAKAYGTEK